MTTAPTPSSPETLELGITRFIDAAPENCSAPGPSPN